VTVDPALAVAIAALAWSIVWSVGWSIWHHRRTATPQVLVQGSFAVAGTLPDPTHVFDIDATNEGLVPVTLTNAFAEVAGATKHVVFTTFVMQSGGQLACVVQPFHRWSGLIDAEQFRAAIAGAAGEMRPPWRVRVGVSGAGRRRFVSEWLDVERGPSEAHLAGRATADTR
jgi:hypothetical protein